MKESTRQARAEVCAELFRRLTHEDGRVLAIGKDGAPRQWNRSEVVDLAIRVAAHHVDNSDVQDKSRQWQALHNHAIPAGLAYAGLGRHKAPILCAAAFHFEHEDHVQGFSDGRYWRHEGTRWARPYFTRKVLARVLGRRTPHTWIGAVLVLEGAERQYIYPVLRDTNTGVTLVYQLPPWKWENAQDCHESDLQYLARCPRCTRAVLQAIARTRR